MKRFYETKKKPHRLLPTISILTFALLLFCFAYGLRQIAKETERSGQVLLEQHLWQEIALCYALEGKYPSSIDYLLAHYPISYDANRYYIGYEIYGSNLLPDVTVMKRGEGF